MDNKERNIINTLLIHNIWNVDNYKFTLDDILSIDIKITCLIIFYNRYEKYIVYRLI